MAAIMARMVGLTTSRILVNLEAQRTEMRISFDSITTGLEIHGGIVTLEASQILDARIARDER